MGSHKSITSRYSEQLTPPTPPPVPAYHVEGDPVPDFDRNFYTHILHDGKMSYANTGLTFFIAWVTIANGWIISEVLGEITGPFWDRVDPDILGIYNPQNLAENNILVASGPA